LTERLGARRGEVWYVDFDPARGSEQAGRRPALIIQNDAGNASTAYPNTIVLAISTKGRDAPFHVKVDPSAANGLRETSYVKCEQILTISKARLVGSRPIGRVERPDLKRIDIALMLSLGIGA
jgi:mRNA interferase MazF